MYRGDTDIFLKRYNEIFDSDEKKATAFDRIAMNYYMGNFGSMQKSDIDVLMFSLMLDEILKQSESDINTYSDYTLAKQLGITQSRVSNLKQKKQLQYPYEDFDWRRSFERCCSNARLDSGKIRINLRDINLYYELKNQVEEMGGYAEASLTKNLLIITPEEFYKLAEQLMPEDEINALRKKIRTKFSDNEDFINKLEKEPFAKALKNQFGTQLIDILFEVTKSFAPGAVVTGLSILSTAIKSIVENR